MSTSLRAMARAPSLSLQRLDPVRMLLVVGMSLGLASALLIPAATAVDPPRVSALDAPAARRAGLGLDVVVRRDLPVALVEVRPAGGGRRGEAALLAATSDGSLAAVAERPGQDPTTLILAAADGSQLRIAMPGILAAAFSPDESWLVVLDGAGSLWRVSPSDGATLALAEGPFLGPLIVEPAGSVLALAVASVEAPYFSHLVRLNPADATISRLSDEELVYGTQLLADGSLAVVAHRPAGTVVRRIGADVDGLLADLGADAVNVSLSADGGILAWQSGDEAFVRSSAAPGTRSLGIGAQPRVAPDGTAILLERAGRTVLVAPDGRPIAQLEGSAILTTTAVAGENGCGECGS